MQVWHRRSGKDLTDIAVVARAMAERVGSYYYLYPTYTQGRKALWEGKDKDGVPFLERFPRELLKGDPNTTEMKLEYKNGSLFRVVGVDKIDSVVGTNPIGCVFSEYSLQNPKGWDFLRPILAENGGWALFNGTPRGQNHFYDQFVQAQADPTWWTQLLTVDDTGAISPEVLEQERREMFAKYGDDSLFRQEYYCDFLSAVLGAYYQNHYNRALTEGRITHVPYEEAVPVYTVWDLGIDDAMAVGFYQGVGVERRMIDYLEVTGMGLPQVIQLCKEKGYTYGMHFAPHDIKVRELGTGKSRLEVAESLGWHFEIVPNIGILDGIDAGRRLFNKLWIDQFKCKDFLKAIPQYTKDYDEERKVFKDYPRHDWTSHAADVHRYAALVEDKFTMTGYNMAPTIKQYSYEDLLNAI